MVNLLFRSQEKSLQYKSTSFVSFVTRYEIPSSAESSQVPQNHGFLGSGEPKQFL